MSNFFQNNKNAFYGGLIFAVFTSVGIFFLGNISGYEAKLLLKESMYGLNMLCNTIILASATILALLLTILSVSSGSGHSIKKRHYKQVLSIAKFDVTLFIAALILYQLFNIPILESENVPTSWFEVIYWATLASTSLISGLMITVILMLYNAVTTLIAIVGLGENHPMVSKSNEEENEIEKEIEKEKHLPNKQNEND